MARGRKKAVRSGFTAQQSTTEGKTLTPNELVNRYLMNVEAGRMERPRDEDDVVADIASSCQITEEQVKQAIAQQVNKRSSALRQRVDRLGPFTGYRGRGGRGAEASVSAH